jgi:hypothetical protein
LESVHPRNAGLAGCCGCLDADFFQRLEVRKSP